MKELISIVIKEKGSLVRGFIAVFMLTLPLTFLPTFLKHGLSWYYLQLRIPDAIMYTGLIALAIIIYALLNNFEKLQHKKYLFGFPAFASLHFQEGIEGYNSFIKELSTYLIGKAGNYYYKLNIDNPEKESFQVEVAPLIEIEDSSIADKLIRELGLKERLYLSRILWYTEEQLQDENALRNELLQLSDELSAFGIMPLEVEEDLIPKWNGYA